MLIPDIYLQSRRFAHHSSACSSRGIASFRVGPLLLMIGGLVCNSRGSLAQTSYSGTADQPNTAWSATTDFKSDDLYPSRIPVRIIESHTENGNRTLEERSVQVKGVDGHLTTYQDIQTETVQVDSTTVRTTIRTFGQVLNGAKSLIQVTEEERHVLPSGESNVLRVTFNPDVNGKLQPTQRETIETKTTSEGVEETDGTVLLPSINGGLAPAVKSHEVRKLHMDGTTESQKTTLLQDGGGKWEVSETREVTTAKKGANRAVEERVFRRDADGKLAEVSRVVSEESNPSSGEQQTIVETYSLDVPGSTRDGNLHQIERATTSSQSNANGGQITEQKVEQRDPGDPSAGLRVSRLVEGKFVPVPAGEQSTVTIRGRDSNGSFGIISVTTTKSDRTSTIQIGPTRSEQSK